MDNTKITTIHPPFIGSNIITRNDTLQIIFPRGRLSPGTIVITVFALMWLGITAMITYEAVRANPDLPYNTIKNDNVERQISGPSRTPLHDRIKVIASTGVILFFYTCGFLLVLIVLSQFFMRSKLLIDKQGNLKLKTFIFFFA